MITSESNPVAWALFLHELSDAAEHLRNLIAQMAADGEMDEVDFSIQLGHAYAHLNRAWNGRNNPQATTNPTDEERAILTCFPTDLQPVG
jgi:hypothetical protein